MLGLVRDDRAIDAGIFGDLADGLLEGALDDLESDTLVVGHVGCVGLLEGERRLDEGDAAAGDDAFLDGRAGRGERVFDSVFLFLHFDFGGRADVDHGDAAGELG